MCNEIQRVIKDLQHSITVAGLNYEIWWIYKEKEYRERFIGILNTYPLFFQTSIHAHFVAMIISLYHLYEKRSRGDTVNFHNLINILKKQSVVPLPKIEKIESDIKTIDPIWKKISILRNNLFGHRSILGDGAEFWEKAGIKPKDIMKIIEESKRILNEIRYLWDKSSDAFNLSTIQDTTNVLEDLKRLNDNKQN